MCSHQFKNISKLCQGLFCSLYVALHHLAGTMQLLQRRQYLEDIWSGLGGISIAACLLWRIFCAAQCVLCMVLGAPWENLPICSCQNLSWMPHEGQAIWWLYWNGFARGPRSPCAAHTWHCGSTICFWSVLSKWNILKISNLWEISQWHFPQAKCPGFWPALALLHLQGRIYAFTI